jgi:hypothetical protein
MAVNQAAVRREVFEGKRKEETTRIVEERLPGSD